MLFLAQTVVSCSENRAREGGCQGAQGHGRRVLFELRSIKHQDSLDIMAFKFREALIISLEINQKFDIEDVLDVIFNDFCIGK